MARLALCVAVLAAAAGAAHGVGDLWSTIEGTAELSTLAALLKQAGLDSVLQGAGPFTVFAPMNDAFERYPMTAYKVAYLKDGANAAVLKSVLEYHVVPGVFRAASLSEDQELDTVEGDALFARVNETGAGDLAVVDTTCGRGDLIVRDVAASNGVIQQVNSVFVPAGKICPDTLFWVEQRGQGRVGGQGMDCRAKGSFLAATAQQKAVGLAADSAEQALFWSDDINNTPYDSWLTRGKFDGTNTTILFSAQLFDPQGVDVDPVAKKVYFTERLGQTVSSANYDGTDRQLLLSTSGTTYPQDVAVDHNANVAFVQLMVKNNDTAGSLMVVNLDGTGAKTLLTDMNKNYGVCLDKVNRHAFYVVGGHGGGLRCLEYGSTPCAAKGGEVITGLNYPYMCAVDTLWAKYGGPSLVFVSLTNMPGSVQMVQANGTYAGEVASGMYAPMGVAIGCYGDV